MLPRQPVTLMAGFASLARFDRDAWHIVRESMCAAEFEVVDEVLFGAAERLGRGIDVYEQRGLRVQPRLGQRVGIGADPLLVHAAVAIMVHCAAAVRTSGAYSAHRW